MWLAYMRKDNEAYRGVPEGKAGSTATNGLHLVWIQVLEINFWFQFETCLSSTKKH